MELHTRNLRNKFLKEFKKRESLNMKHIYCLFYDAGYKTSFSMR